MAKVSVKWREKNVAECTVDGTISEVPLAFTAKNKSLAIFRQPEIHPRKYLSAPWEEIIKSLFGIKIVKRIGGVEVDGNTVTIHFIGKSLTDLNRKYFEDLLITKLGGEPNALPVAPDETTTRVGGTAAVASRPFSAPLARIQAGTSSANLALLRRLETQGQRAAAPRLDSSGRKSSLLPRQGATRRFKQT